MMCVNGPLQDPSRSGSAFLHHVSRVIFELFQNQDEPYRNIRFSSYTELLQILSGSHLETRSSSAIETKNRHRQMLELHQSRKIR